jgi:hypothetical protein
VTNTNFDDFFTAVPNYGWYFEKWNSGDRFFCADTTSPMCVLSLRSAKGNAVIEELVASSETFYLMPVFKPAPDIITVDGKEWYQPYLFLTLSWNDINSVCPAGKCAGMLNGHDMAGWTWASIEDVNALFNYYIGSEVLGPGPDGIINPGGDSAWAPAFYSDRWRFTHGPSSNRGSRAVYANMRDLPELGKSYIGGIYDDIHDGVGVNDGVYTTGRHRPAIGSPYVGGWFYRSP